MSTKIFVGSLPWAIDDNALKEAFEAFGPVVSAKVIKDRQTGKSKGFGFVEMEDETQAQAAIQGLNGSKLGNRNVIVNEAKSKV